MVLNDRFLESTWYTRVDYFHWNERLAGQDFVNEDGPLVTLGYLRRIGIERFRVELFGGDVHYGADIEFDDGTSEPLASTTGYLGVRGEYDLLLQPDWWPRASFLVGLGTRLWVRDLRDETLPSGVPVVGYQETWWTIYPYLGIETRCAPGEATGLYGSARIGCTPLTYEHVTLFDVRLHPRTGVTGQLECGWRGRRLHLAGFFEAMTWAQSGAVRGVLQPESRLFTLGLKTGFSF